MDEKGMKRIKKWKRPEVVQLHSIDKAISDLCMGISCKLDTWFKCLWNQRLGEVSAKELVEGILLSELKSAGIWWLLEGVTGGWGDQKTSDSHHTLGHLWLQGRSEPSHHLLLISGGPVDGELYLRPPITSNSPPLEAVSAWILFLQSGRHPPWE